MCALLSFNKPELPVSQNAAEGLENRKKYEEHFRTSFEKLMRSGKMDGIRVKNTQPALVSLGIDGPSDKIEELNNWLQAAGLGVIVDFAVQLPE